jgi:hypothetical protein
MHMFAENLSKYVHDHVFDAGRPDTEPVTRAATWMSVAMMAIAVIAGCPGDH